MATTPSISFSSISPGFTLRIGLDHLSARDKVDLFRVLMDDLGITERFHSEPDETSRAQTIITEQWFKAWG